MPRFGGEPEIYRDGPTTIIDLTFDRAGNPYVLQVQDEGLLSNDLTSSLLRFAPGFDQPDDQPDVVARDSLVSPTSVAVADDGSIYVSNYGYFPGQGQVVRLPPGLTPLPSLRNDHGVIHRIDADSSARRRDCSMIVVR